MVGCELWNYSATATDAVASKSRSDDFSSSEKVIEGIIWSTAMTVSTVIDSSLSVPSFGRPSAFASRSAFLSDSRADTAPLNLAGRIAGLEKDGWVAVRQERLIATPQGRKVLDAVVRTLLV